MSLMWVGISKEARKLTPTCMLIECLYGESKRKRSFILVGGRINMPL